MCLWTLPMFATPDAQVGPIRPNLMYMGQNEGQKCPCWVARAAQVTEVARDAELAAESVN